MRNKMRRSLVATRSLAIACALVCGLLVTKAQAAAGDLDPAFGTGGKVITQFFEGDYITAMAIQPDGKIIAAGIGGMQTTPGNFFYDVLMARYNTDGSLDQTFGTGGKVISDLSSNVDTINAIAFQPDGKIVVAGTTSAGSPIGTNLGYNFLLARYNSDGSLDTNFGTSGGATFTDYSGGTTNDDMINAIVIQPDGKIVVAGYARMGAVRDFALARYNSNGTLDTSFGTGGKLSTALSTGDDEAHALLLQPDGKVVAIGYAAGASFDFALARFDVNGQPDATFGTGGKVVSDFNGLSNYAYAAVLQPDGKIVAAGYGRAASSAAPDFAIARYNTDGSPDTGFGTNGSTLTDFFGNEDRIYALVRQPNGKFVAAGFAGLQSNVNDDFGLARYNSNGTIDTTFGTGGKVTTSFANVLGDDEARALVLQPDGKIVAGGGGRVQVNGNSRFALARYFGDVPAAVKSDFDGDGRTDVSVFRPSQGVWYILQSSANSLRAQPFGLSDDHIVPADYDGDGITDIAVWRASNGFWYIINSSDNTFRAQQWGLGSSDVPVPADYDGDRKADLAVFRYGSEVSTPTVYYILQSMTQTQRTVQWGDGAVSVAVPADYDGDGKADVAVYSEAGGIWRILQSTDNGVRSEAFGAGNFQDTTVPADYDGDGKADLAVFRRASGSWYLQRSTAGFTGIQFGVSDDVPVPGDYDGDGKADVAVFRTGNWYVLRSQLGFIGVQFGTQGDVPAVRAR